MDECPQRVNFLIFSAAHRNAKSETHCPQALTTFSGGPPRKKLPSLASSLEPTTEGFPEKNQPQWQEINARKLRRGWWSSFSCDHGARPRGAFTDELPLAPPAYEFR